MDLTLGAGNQSGLELRDATGIGDVELVMDLVSFWARRGRLTRVAASLPRGLPAGNMPG
ncbi:MAG: hypothetical protein JSU87_10235 [Gemmatimonadota bacterium]|nr:MAG: hypothetical protein JSU87_10235 [Gemmatimonadota bacterium]